MELARFANLEKLNGRYGMSGTGGASTAYQVSSKPSSRIILWPLGKKQIAIKNQDLMLSWCLAPTTHASNDGLDTHQPVKDQYSVLQKQHTPVTAQQ